MKVRRRHAGDFSLAINNSFWSRKNKNVNIAYPVKSHMMFVAPTASEVLRIADRLHEQLRDNDDYQNGHIDLLVAADDPTRMHYPSVELIVYGTAKTCPMIDITITIQEDTKNGGM